MVLGSGATRMTARELLRELRQMRQAGFDEHASPRTMNRSSLASRLPKDVQEVFAHVVAHRLLLSDRADGKGITAEQVLSQIIDGVVAPKLR